MAAAMAFAHQPLARSVAGTKDPDFLASAAPSALFVVYSDGNVLTNDDATIALRKANALPAPVRLDLANDGRKPSPQGANLPPYLLGQRVSDGTLCFVVDITGVEVDEEGFLVANKVALVPVRELMMKRAGDADSVSIAGLAHAICRWHQSSVFCGYTGKRTAPIEAGLKRIAAHDPEVDGERVGAPLKHYIRINPVCIVLVTNQEHTHALLGRYHRAPPGFFTCLAGFIEFGEQVEAACQREVLEESGVRIHNVRIKNSQAWPVARGGHCELMIGAYATAEAHADDALPPVQFDDKEMADVRWFSRAEVARAVQASRTSDAMTANSGGSGHSSSVLALVPGPFALAHHLLCTFAEEHVDGSEPKL